MTETIESTVIAAFRNNADAEAAAADLKSAGISSSDIHVEGNTGKTEGGITGWFKSIFGEDSDKDRNKYETAVNQGNYLLRVDVHDAQLDSVEEILNRHSPLDVYEEDEEDEDVLTTSGSGNTGAAYRTDGTIPVVQEELQVGKREVLRGGVRVFSRTVHEPVEESVRLREEHVRVERRPVNRAATEADLAAGQERVIEVQEFAEEAVVGKQARVVEEIRVGKDVSERQETIRDTVRHTEVNVEQAPGKGGRTFDDTDFRTDFQRRYPSGDASYETYQPAYRYGYEMAEDPRYDGRSFDESEADLRAGYGSANPNSAWEKTKDAVRYGWDKVTGKSSAGR